MPACSPGKLSNYQIRKASHKRCFFRYLVEMQSYKVQSYKAQSYDVHNTKLLTQDAFACKPTSWLQRYTATLTLCKVKHPAPMHARAMIDAGGTAHMADKKGKPSASFVRANTIKPKSIGTKKQQAASKTVRCRDFMTNNSILGLLTISDENIVFCRKLKASKRQSVKASKAYGISLRLLGLRGFTK